MSSAFLLPGLRRGALLATPLILSTPFLIHSYRNPILCDSPAGFQQGGSSPLSTYTRDAKVPIVKQSGAPNPKAVRQISLGSILGVMGGLGVSVFSKPLALLIGLGVIIVQLLESRGIHLIPYSFLQNRVKNTNVKSLLLDNVAFKLAFGTTFALASFAEL